MSNIQRAEVQVYAAVLAGDLEIDAEGRVWRIAKRGWDRWKGEAVSRPCRRVRAENAIPTGYLQVRMMLDGTRHHALAHRLVWMHTHGPIPEGMVLNHKNGVKADNRLENLEIVTPSGNIRHAVKAGLHPAARQHGERNPAATLTTSDVREIRRRRATGERLASIAADFGITYQTVSKIARRDRRSRG